MTIKPIQTTYKGYRFRSRLEARWAVFFDAMGLQWEYEPEGFELPGGVRYLPDFRVGDVWFEVKHSIAADDGKAMLFAADSGETIGVLDGPPAMQCYLYWGGDQPPDYFFFTKHPTMFGSRMFFGECKPPRDFPEWFHPGDAGWAPVVGAINKALAARFEYGETPQ